MQPAHLGPDGGRIVRIKAAAQPAPDAIRARVAARAGPDVQGLAALITAGGFQRGTHVVALRRPAGQVAFKRGIGHPVGSVRGADHFDVVQQTLAFPQQHNLHVVRRISNPIVQPVGRLDGRPGRLARFLAVRPVGRQAMV